MAQAVSKSKSPNSTNGKSQNSYDQKTWLSWFETMYRIRKFEEKTLMMYSQQKIRGFCHVYIGQEAIAAGLVTGIQKEDAVVTGYRQHGIALCRGLSSESCMAELYGKATGCVKGKGGSMHFFSKEHRFFGGNGIVGAQIPIGTGIAFAEKYKETNQLCVTMFGDGAARQGALYESFNMAMTWKLPVIYIVENNGYAMGTSVERTSNVTDLYKIGSSFEMPSEQVNGMDPVAVHEALVKAAAHCRAGKGPYFLEIKTYRYRGHSVSDPVSYRKKEEVEHYKTLDPVVLIEEKILKQKIASAAEIEEIKERIKNEIDAAVEFAENSPFPEGKDLYEDNYVQTDYPFIKD
ncbi:MAG: pyruvate dehydrogenase (acetyl-transferring) E1 component subunit alpha [Saprospiraceae bacterium]|nr:pyruvate dehydrogenase (acetyl-transferring) E1 component subunit alpha [Saprospiraceae bacterium]